MRTTMVSRYLCSVLLFVLLLLPHSPASALKRQEVLACGFADGSKAELRATHEWHMLGAIFQHYGDVSSRSEQTPYAVSVKEVTGSWLASPGWVRYANPQDGDELHIPTGVSTCARVARWNGRFLVNRSFLQDDGQWFAGDVLHLQFTRDIPSWVGEHLHRIHGGASPGRVSFLAPVNGLLVHEQAISDRKAGFVVRSVYQSVSKNGGQTWSAPIITPHARIFEIGRRFEDQSFAGRPLDFEGQAFPKPVFPAPQTEEERARAIQALPAAWREVVTAPAE